jgi:uncharacterized phage infection (PIP) family protein YhgE
MATKKTADKPEHAKKEFKKKLADKMESAMPEIKTKLGDKKFQRRIKKATKLLVHGLHNDDFALNGETNKAAKTAVKKIKSAKKSKAKKQEEPADN